MLGKRLCACVLCAFCFVSCSRKTSFADLSFPSSSRVSSQDRYALIIDPYVSLRDEPGDSGITVSHGRRGDIVLITGRKIVSSEGKRSKWIHSSKGWLPESSVYLYSSEQTARTAAQELLNGELPKP
ncbi:MAG: hypothetical protein JW875_08595 [Spirochaetales bacterium]|nr:hypothetical protein [Spirochaetales bacterium]